MDGTTVMCCKPRSIVHVHVSAGCVSGAALALVYRRLQGCIDSMPLRGDPATREHASLVLLYSLKFLNEPFHGIESQITIMGSYHRLRLKHTNDRWRLRRYSPLDRYVIDDHCWVVATHESGNLGFGSKSLTSNTSPELNCDPLDSQGASSTQRGVAASSTLRAQAGIAYEGTCNAADLDRDIWRLPLTDVISRGR
ncbi:unnamed protein product [Phytophthora fragariaefolia]|uniref:Unnamed protein product n=1 Tax=Phytophthora fragariaefolia TaxID=1490495 RepID=A0A9W7D0M7_9STRA|nr:unnamed protein product [Phytophthora fragariaefolia]